MVLFYRFVYGCMFCILLFDSVSFVSLFLCLCILIDMHALFCIFFINWHSPATVTKVFPCFSSVVSQMPGYTSQRRGTARTLSNFCLFYVFFVLCIFVLFYVLLVLCRSLCYFCVYVCA